MKTSSIDRPGQYAPFSDVDPATGRSIEVFFADRSLEKFGWCGAGWFWWPRRRGFAPTGPGSGPFPSSYSAFRGALRRRMISHGSDGKCKGFD
jgi:hypothetical protein